MSDQESGREANVQKALAIAKKLSSIVPALESGIFLMELEGAKRGELRLAIIHKKPGGGGRVGPTLDLAEFLQDMKEMSTLLHSEEELVDLSAGGIVALFGGAGGEGESDA
jgi:hypothetical protein